VNLVAQGPAITPEQADELARLAGTIRIDSLSRHAYRLRNAAPNDAIAPWCEARRIDYAFIPEGRRFAALKLLAMDMDSTLITI
jgi:phosphoserine phosphatase